jgi:hypothetical protein
LKFAVFKPGILLLVDEPAKAIPQPFALPQRLSIYGSMQTPAVQYAASNR